MAIDDSKVTFLKPRSIRLNEDCQTEVVGR